MVLRETQDSYQQRKLVHPIPQERATMPRHTDTRSHHDDDETRESEHRDENANDELADELDMEDAGHDAVRPPMSRDAGVFGIGLTVGLLIGAGLALLLAPQ